jgi:shikimate kinase / 3-dehydroquinate synthase
VIVLVGFMGAGKTTVGRILAGDLGGAFVDTDDVIAQQAGMSVRAIFDAWGESGFRQFERSVVAEALAGPDGVIGLGGGALTDDGTRRALEEREELIVVHLDVSFDEAMRRVGGDEGRPMLTAGDPRLLYESRRALYEEAATFTVPTDGMRPDAVARAIAAHIGETAAPLVRGVPVSAPGGSYEVVVGAGLLGDLARFIPEIERAEKAFVITHPELRHLADPIVAGLEMPVEVIDIPAGEASKSLETAHEVYARLAGGAAHRSDLVLGVGGGVVTDIAGFVASTFNRGMRVVHVPTSLLAQVDAAVGGKTGVNLAEGKNLVGTFHQPVAVVCDTRTLRTLPEAELRSGMAEVVKYGLIADPDLLELVTDKAADLFARDERLLLEIVARSVAIKAAIVSEDEREGGRRAVLNYGHTFAHAIEQTSGFEGFRHGEAVAVGMMAAAWLARLLDRLDEEGVAAHRRALEAIELPTTALLDLDRLEQAWKRDKKYDRGVRFVLLSRIGHAEYGITAPRDAIAEAIARVSG